MTANYKHHHDTKQYCELRRSMASSLVHDKSMEDQYATPHSTWTHWPEKGDRTSTDSRPRLENMSTMFRSSASILLVVGCGVTRSGSVLDPQVTVLSLLDVFSACIFNFTFPRYSHSRIVYEDRPAMHRRGWSSTTGTTALLYDAHRTSPD